MADLSNIRIRCAMHIPGDRESAARQDTKALQWMYERITDDQELEPFVERIPGFLSSVDGCKTRRVASQLRESTVWAIENRLTVLLEGRLTSTPHFKRASIYLDALLIVFVLPTIWNDCPQFFSTNHDDGSLE
ncbi:hypothetical protein C0991_000975 [Blastosporella zonata]|nr:hypothetical protein C0991_000975 [Blastosporella zonata]